MGRFGYLIAATSDLEDETSAGKLRYPDTTEHPAKTTVEIHTLRPAGLSTALLACRHHCQQLLDAGNERDCRQLIWV